MEKLPEWIRNVIVDEHKFMLKAENIPAHPVAGCSRFRAERMIGPLSAVLNVHDREGGGYRLVLTFLGDFGPATSNVLASEFGTQAELDRLLHTFLRGAKQILESK